MRDLLEDYDGGRNVHDVTTLRTLNTLARVAANEVTDSEYVGILGLSVIESS